MVRLLLRPTVCCLGFPAIEQGYFALPAPAVEGARYNTEGALWTSPGLAGNFRHDRAKSRAGSLTRRRIPRRTNPSGIGPGLALPNRQRSPMLRLSVLAVVLTLGIGPNMSILCGTWCAGDSLPQACHQQLASLAVVEDDCCDGRVINRGAILSGESRQDSVSPSQEAVEAHHHVALRAASVPLSHRHEPRGSNQNCLVTVLRI